MTSAQDKLDDLNARLVKARQELRETQHARQQALQRQGQEEDELLTAEARHAAGEIGDREVKKAREAVGNDGTDWDRELALKERTVAVLEASLTEHVAANLGELEQAIADRQAEDEREADAQLNAAMETVGRLHDGNAQRARLRQLARVETASLPNWQRWEELRQLLRKRKQREAGVA